jgi:hypothetical protein
MKYIVEINGVELTKYKYNIWSVAEFDDCCPRLPEKELVKDTRIFETDSLEEFLLFQKTLFSIKS